MKEINGIEIHLFSYFDFFAGIKGVKYRLKGRLFTFLLGLTSFPEFLANFGFFVNKLALFA